MAKAWSQHSLFTISLAIGANISGRLHHLHHSAILWWQIFYLHDQLGLWSDHDHNVSCGRERHTLALRSTECAESGAGGGTEGAHIMRPKDILVAIQCIIIAGTNHIHSILDISQWSHEWVGACNSKHYTEQNTYIIQFNSIRVDKPTRFPVISIVTHALNTVCMLIDFLVVAFPLRLWHMVQTMCMAIAFFLFTLIYHFCGGTDE